MAAFKHLAICDTCEEYNEYYIRAEEADAWVKEHSGHKAFCKRDYWPNRVCKYERVEMGRTPEVEMVIGITRLSEMVDKLAQAIQRINVRVMELEAKERERAIKNGE